MKTNLALKKVTAKKLATTVRQELLYLEKANHGLVTPKNVVDFARSNPNSALHRKFEWDDNKAAEAYRLHQARQIITMVLTVVKQTGEKVQSYVSLRTDRYKNNDGGYRNIRTVLNHKDLRAQMLEDALAEMKVFRQKYESLSELAKVFTAIDEVLK